MKIRIKFEKQDLMKFIGHLDMMRYFQKAMRRADIDIKYSEGFSPHQIMSFAAPLGVGLTSTGEYVDIEVDTSESSNESIERLNSVMADGVKILSYKRLPDDAKNAMSIVAAADYTVHFRNNETINNIEDFLKQQSIVVLKKTKNGEQETDIRPAIYELKYINDGLHMKLAAGSIKNVKPELVMQAYYAFAGKEYDKMAYTIQRDEVYADIGSGEAVLTPLEELGEDIE